MKTKSPKATIGDDVLALDSTKTKAFEKALKTAKSAKVISDKIKNGRAFDTSNNKKWETIF